MFVSRRHYSKETGGFYCFSGECCEELGLPATRYNFPVIVYDTDRKGSLVSASFEVQYLQCNQARYEEFLTYLDNGQDLTDMDFVISCQDEQYQKLNIAGFTGATWRKNKDFAKSVLSRVIKAWAFAPQVIASKMTRKTFLEKVGQAPAESAPAENDMDLDAFLKG